MRGHETYRNIQDFDGNPLKISAQQSSLDEKKGWVFVTLNPVGPPSSRVSGSFYLDPDAVDDLFLTLRDVRKERAAQQVREHLQEIHRIQQEFGLIEEEQDA